MASKKVSAVSPPRGGIETPEMARRDIAAQKKSPVKKAAPKKKPAGNKVQPKKPDDLETVLEANYPQYSFILRNPDVFGQDVVDVLRRADAEDWTADRFVAAIQQTRYWTTTVASAKNFDALNDPDRQTLMDQTMLEVKGITGVEGIDPTLLNTFIRDMTRRGVKGDSLKTMTYQFVFNQGVQTKAAKEALFTQEASAMKLMARSYGQMITDDQIRTNLTNGVKAGDLQVKYRAKLKALYPHLSSQLDADLTFDEIVSDYRQLAAQTLERNPESIDFMKPEFMEAIATRDDKGNTRQLSLGEWQQKLRTDDRYGYSKTNQAVREARTLATALARAFGRIS